MRIRTVLIGFAVVLGLAGAALASFIAGFDANRYKSQLVEQVHAHTGQTLVIDGDLALSLWPPIGLSMGAATLSGADGQGPTATVASARVAVALRPLLSGRLHLAAVALQDLTLTAGADDGWRLEAARLDAAPIADGATGRLTLHGRLRTAGGTDALAIALESAFLPDLHAGTLALSGLTAQGQGSVAGLRGLAGTLGGHAVLNLRTRQLTATPLTVTASLDDAMRLSVAGSAELDAVRELATLGLAGTLDDRAVALSMQLEGFAPLATRWQLTADELDLDRLQAVLAAARQPDGAEPPPAGSEPAPAIAADRTATDAGGQALPLALAGIVSQGELSIGQLHAGGLTLDTLSATVGTGEGRIELAGLDATLYGGQLHATATLADAGHRLKGSLTDVQAGALLQALGGHGGLSGLGSVQFDLHGQGREHPALIGSLGGSLSLSVRNGAIHGLDLEQILQQVQAALDGRLPVEGGPQAGASTPFQSLAADFRLARGIATSENLDFRADRLHATGRGHLNLPARTLDWLIQARVVDPGPDAGRRSLAARLQGLTLPVRLTGSFDALRYRVALETLAADLARKELERRLTEKLGGKPADPARPGGPARPGDMPTTPLDLLKGLLRR